MIDDFVLYTMVNNLCIDNKVEMAFNLRKTFKNFVLQASRPSHAMVASQEDKDEEGGGQGNTKLDEPLTIERQYLDIRKAKQ